MGDGGSIRWAPDITGSYGSCAGKAWRKVREHDEWDMEAIISKPIIPTPPLQLSERNKNSVARSNPRSRYQWR